MSDPAQLRSALFEPEAVAIIGASEEAGKVASRPVQFLTRHGFAGEVFPINPRRTTVLGRTCYPSLGDLPRKVDQAYILLPTDPAMAAVEDCVRHGVKAVSILADGFAEAGAAGQALQHRLTEMLAGTGCRLLGPNSLGLLRTWNGLSMTANAAFAQDKLLRGRYSVLSQSGSLIGTFYSRGKTRGIGFANLVSVGNEADLSIGEIGECLVDDERTDAFLLFLETIRHADRLADFARAAHRAGKPIVAYKLGRSEVGAELAVSHTGALVGSDRAADALLRDLGISRVNVFEALLESPPLLRRPKRPGSNRAATMLTTTGGGAAMVADQLGLLGVDVAGIDALVRGRLLERGIEIKPGRIADLTLAGTRYETLRAIIDELLATRDVGVLALVIGSSAEFLPQQTVAPIVDAVKAAPPGHPPVAVFLVPHAEQAMHMLAEADIPCFRTPEACADAIRAWAEARVPRTPVQARLAAEVTDLIAHSGARSNEREALRVFAECGVACVQQMMFPVEEILRSKSLAGLPTFPVVAKLVSADLPHKTDAGAVTLDIRTLQELQAATERMLASARRYAPAAHIEGVLVQQQRPAVGEVLLGLRRDPSVGAVLTLGMGGVAAEVYRDIALRIAPITPAEAAEMFEDVKGFALLKGFRGKPRGDLAALATAAARFSELAADARIVEAEINPILVLPEGQGVVAVDGLLVMSS
jgi:acyl-CoA synthetase (NDP forming)